MAQKNSFTHTNLLDVDVSSLKPMPNKLIVYVDEEEMLQIGKTNLVLGYWEDNRNNSHWFGKVVAKHPDVPLELGDEVWYSFLSARGCDRIISFGKLYIILNFDYLILYKRNDEIHMLNDHILALNAPPEKNSVIEYEVQNLHKCVIKHIKNDSVYKPEETVYYLLDQVFELEGQKKLLGENYRVIREENILGKLQDSKLQLDTFNVSEGMMIVKEFEEKKILDSGIIIPDTAKRRVMNIGTVIKSGCAYQPDEVIIFRKSKGRPVELDEVRYVIVDADHVEATCQDDI